jgi:hypothetical protein
MYSTPTEVKRILDENLFLLQMLNLDFRQNQEFEVDLAFNPFLEPSFDPLSVSLLKTYETSRVGQTHFVSEPS